MTAPRDANRQPTILATLNTDGLTPVSVLVDAATHSLRIDNSMGGGSHPFVNAERDANRVPTIWGVSSADGTTPIPIYCDSSGNLLVQP